MIEPPRLVGKILSGQKTRSTRPLSARLARVKLRHSYPVHTGHRKPEVTRVKVTAVEEGMLDQVTEEDARAEGFEDLAAFFADFRERWHTGPLIPVEVEIVHYELDVEAPPRLLGRRAVAVGPGASRDAALGYVTNPEDALEDAGEAVDETTQDRFSSEADARFAKLRADERIRKDTQRQIARLRQARNRAYSAGVDVEPEVHAIEKQLKAIEEKLA